MHNNDYNGIYLNVLKSTFFIHTARIVCLTNIHPALPHPVPGKVFVLALAIYLSCLFIFPKIGHMKKILWCFIILAGIKTKFESKGTQVRRNNRDLAICKTLPKN